MKVDARVMDTATTQDKARQKPKKSARPEWIAVKSFALAILVGTFLLALPVSSREGVWTAPVDALFTATSATCVTGLIVVDTGSYFSGFGQSVILALIQVGGLGIMTLGTFLLVAVGRRVSISHEKVVLGAIGTVPVRGLKSILLLTILFTVVSQLIGAAILTTRFMARGFGQLRSVELGVFHSISAFCNAGFSLFADSLIGVRQDPALVLTVSCLIVLGGLGFLVVHNIAFLRPWRRNRVKRGRLALHSKLVLTATGLLIVSGWLLFALLEWHGTLEGLPLSDKLTAALFHSITPRTAGFNVVDMAEVSPSGQFLTMVFMFIGGGSGSTAGGIKVTTVMVLWLTVVAMVKGRGETVVGNRAVPIRVVREAVSIFVLGALCVILLFGALLVVEQYNLLLKPGVTAFDLLFELVSAFGTVGLSTGVTADLSPAGKLLITVCMFIGRLGPMTLALVIGHRELGQSIAYPEEELFVG
ncbi:MAG: TrkH family potassium uptake protein [Lentisphaeria bacterium]|nr:TrkH family potassium uptake protein [Lentisphaeria bacterium]